MRNPPVDVNALVQPPMFRLDAIAIAMHALVDHLDATVVFVVESRDPLAGGLCALWSSAPIPLEDHLKGLHEAHKEFLRQLFDASGPFP